MDSLHTAFQLIAMAQGPQRLASVDQERFVLGCVVWQSHNAHHVPGAANAAALVSVKDNIYCGNTEVRAFLVYMQL